MVGGFVSIEKLFVKEKMGRDGSGMSAIVALKTRLSR